MPTNIMILQFIWELNRFQVHSFRRYGYDTHTGNRKITISNIEFLIDGNAMLDGDLRSSVSG